jgi:hypothetical protein
MQPWHQPASSVAILPSVSIVGFLLYHFDYCQRYKSYIPYIALIEFANTKVNSAERSLDWQVRTCTNGKR